MSPQTRFRFSLGCLLVAVLVVPLMLFFARGSGSRATGWDALGEFLSILVIGGLLVTLLLIASAAFGVSVARQQKRVLWWTIPLLCLITALVATSFALATAALLNAGAKADELMGAVGMGVGLTSLAMIAVWLLDIGAGKRWPRLQWWTVGAVGLSATTVLVLALNWWL